MNNRRTVADASDFADPRPPAIIATVITDASLSPSTGIGGWAGRIIVQGRQATFSGAFKRRYQQSNDVELMAVANTLWRGVLQNMFPPDCGWLIQLDNTHAIQTLNWHFQDPSNKSRPRNRPLPTPASNDAIERVRTLFCVYTPRFILARHVKGHVRKGDRDPRHHVQEAMDRLAKAARIDAERREMNPLGELRC